MPIVSKRFIDTRTGEIVTSVLLSQIQHFEEYDGPLQKGDFDTRLAGHMRNAGDHASVADAGDTAVTMPSEAECRHQWAISEETDRAYCQQCGADGDA